MDFLGMGAQEVILVLIVALIIFGPGKVVEISRTIGKMTRAFKRATSDLTSQINRELETEEKNQPQLKEESSKSDRQSEQVSAVK